MGKTEKHCFKIMKAVCEEKSKKTSREVCVYNYEQKTIVAPAQLTEVTFERRHESLGVTHCSPSYHYRDECSTVYKEVPYRVPTITEYVDDFIELSVPEPKKMCQVFEFEIPEVSCKDEISEECVELRFLKPKQVTESIDSVRETYKGMCQSQDITQNQKICTKEVRKKI